VREKKERKKKNAPSAEEGVKTNGQGEEVKATGPLHPDLEGVMGAFSVTHPTIRISLLSSLTRESKPGQG
jgi:hypothetical protein